MQGNSKIVDEINRYRVSWGNYKSLRLSFFVCLFLLGSTANAQNASALLDCNNQVIVAKERERSKGSSVTEFEISQAGRAAARDCVASYAPDKPIESKSIGDYIIGLILVGFLVGAFWMAWLYFADLFKKKEREPTEEDLTPEMVAILDKYPKHYNLPENWKLQFEWMSLVAQKTGKSHNFIVRLSVLNNNLKLERKKRQEQVNAILARSRQEMKEKEGEIQREVKEKIQREADAFLAALDAKEKTQKGQKAVKTKARKQAAKGDDLSVKSSSQENSDER